MTELAATRTAPIVALAQESHSRHPGLLDLDPVEIARKFPAEPFGIRHRLAGHPLFSLPRLMELGRQLPPENVEYNAGDLPLSVDPTLTPRTGLSIEETIRRIEDCGSWMVIKFVEQDPAYRELLDRCVDEVLAHCDPPIPGVKERYAFIFVSSPNAVTPFHIDPEHNFLLQIRGTKTMAVFPEADRSVISEQDLERFYSGAHRNLAFDQAYDQKATLFPLSPGEGVHVPVTAPHWVRNGDQVSISFSITFRSAMSERRETLYKVNHRLRRMRLEPAPVGRLPAVDTAKLFAFRAALQAKKWIGGRRQPPLHRS